MKLHPAITGNLTFGKRLVDSSLHGAGSGTRRALDAEPLPDLISRAVKEAGVPAIIGAVAGVAASLWRGDGRAPRTAAVGFTPNDSFDVGRDLYSPVSDAYFERAPFKFNGKLEKINIKYV